MICWMLPPRFLHAICSVVIDLKCGCNAPTSHYILPPIDIGRLAYIFLSYFPLYFHRDQAGLKYRSSKCTVYGWRMKCHADAACCVVFASNLFGLTGLLLGLKLPDELAFNTNAM